MDALSKFLAVLVVLAATSYVVAEQPWFQSAIGPAGLQSQRLGIIRCPLSYHR